jgi:hypothetical protein
MYHAKLALLIRPDEEIEQPALDEQAEFPPAPVPAVRWSTIARWSMVRTVSGVIGPESGMCRADGGVAALVL